MKIQSFLKNLWAWLDGNKTVFGLFLAYLLSKAWFTNLVGVEATDFLNWICDTFLLVGVAHKIVKARTQESNQ